MKSTRNFLGAAVALVALSPVGLAWAGGQHQITVSASVTGTCVVNDTTSTLSFGALNPASGGTVNATWSTGSFRCTNGTTYTVSSNDGGWETSSGGANNRMKRAGATDCSAASDCIRYTLTSVTGGTGQGMSNNISFAVTGSTSLADYQDAKEGSYQDVVTLTVSP
jgi:hypothetical protein